MDLGELFEDLSELFIPYGELGLFVLSFFNSSISPLPSETVLIPLVLLEPSNAVWLATIATVASSLGAVFGYYIGLYGGTQVVERLSGSNHEKINQYIDKHGLFIVGLSGVSPLPFKVFCIGAGIFRLGAKKLFLVSIVFRGFRFFSIALLVGWLGEEGVEIIEEHLFLSFLILSISLTVAYALYIKSKEYIQI